ncbi:MULTISPECIES: hypothetical protein [Arthrobacter]|uniref:Uncharacterized protein n=1 Tax=Arthrobacter terricola TaxID=2547396 RepID=A0A4R5KCH0_9MICC|nr:MULTISPECIES: hypothetical protein [Arthrobacter]MBT8162570.1 hypothetical protein [Arthrobacter sp. GN70]TDF92873.1 hypothetical protein E1809_17085 [Arthrobacter terricola]
MNIKKKDIVTLIGVVIVFIAAFKTSVIGYYPREMVWIIPMYIVGVVLAVIGRKMPAEKP